MAKMDITKCCLKKKMIPNSARTNRDGYCSLCTRNCNLGEVHRCNGKNMRCTKSRFVAK